MGQADLLPVNSTAWERALADAAGHRPAIEAAVINIKRAKLVLRPPSFLPFLHYEYGLRELAIYLPNPYALIDQGRAWQEIRGTAPAIDLALSWLGMAGAVEEASPERNFWNAFSLIFTTLPESDAPLLERIEGVASLSAPMRSKFRRGVFGYDVRALEAEFGRLDNAMLDWSSGIKATQGTRLFPEGAIWSFGRVHEIDHLYTEEEGTALGNWLDPVEGDPLAWVEMTYPWIEATFPWAASAEVQRRALLASWFASRPIYLALRDGDGEPIGWRRCRAVWPVAAAFGCAYSFDGTDYDPAAAGGRLYVEAMTDFDDADGVEVAEAALLVDPDLAAGIPPGRRWLAPDELSGGVEFAASEISVGLRRTVRDRFKFMIRF
jgi:hypothetical protein